MAAGDNVAFTATGVTPPVDGFLQANGDGRQAFVVGDATAANTAAVDGDGRLEVIAEECGNATVTPVPASATSTTVIAANANRRGLKIHAVTSSSTCYVREGGAAATSALGGHSFDISPGQLYEFPFGYKGAVTAIWAGTSGGLNVTEYTP